MGGDDGDDQKDDNDNDKSEGSDKDDNPTKPTATGLLFATDCNTASGVKSTGQASKENHHRLAFPSVMVFLAESKFPDEYMCLFCGGST